jgi:acetyl-CoA acetyltransferase
MREVAVIGEGLCRFGFFKDRSLQEMSEQAIWNALKDAGVPPKAIETAYCGIVGWDLSSGISQYGQLMLDQVGIDRIPVTRVENMCCSSSIAFREAWIAVASGMYDVAMAFGAEKMTPWEIADGIKTQKGISSLSGQDHPGSMGFFPPVFFAMMANAYMDKYNISKKDFRRYMSLVVEKNRSNGTMNPNATFQKAVKAKDIMGSPLITDPIHLLDACAENDGCAAVVLASKAAARKYSGRPVYISASVLVGGNYSFENPIFNYLDPNQRAIKEAYETAGIGPEDIDLAIVHDCFSVAEILWMEGLGFCEPGEAGPMLERGETEIGGKLPINTDGGLLSKGHPLGATGVGMVCEAVKQLRGEAGPRQVRGAKVALCQNEGGIVKGQIGNTVISILKK